MTKGRDLIIGIDAGTSVIKAVAFDMGGRQIDAFPVRNSYLTGDDGAVTQSMEQTWKDCVASLVGLAEKIPDLAERTAAVSLTGQGDGTWLIDSKGQPVSDAWLWLDARAAPTVSELLNGSMEHSRFQHTGTGLNTCQQGSQLAHMLRHQPELIARADMALHCKDWLYFRFTGERVTDPSEACFTFGDFRTRQYSETVIEALGLSGHRHLLPDIMEGTEQSVPMTDEAAKATGLHAGTPIVLGYVDMAMTALGAGVRTGKASAACSVLGSTGVHLFSKDAGKVTLNNQGTGYLICLPVPGVVAESQTNMAATLNVDWLLSVAQGIIAEFGSAPDHRSMVERIDQWMSASKPGQILYHPYISEAGERGPFMDAAARASLIGLNATHRFPDLVRAVVEGLGMAARDCFSAMGELPGELRVTGGAAQSKSLRQVMGSSINAPVRLCARSETGAAGAAMMAAVCIGAYGSMDDCIAEWVTPLLGEPELPDSELVSTYSDLFEAYRESRQAIAPVWQQMNALHHTASSVDSGLTPSADDRRHA